MSPHSATQESLSELIGDKYEILRWIGGGGMAEVFLARHRQHGGLVAVKVLSANLAGEPRIVARFIQEARTAATLSGHPNIVTIFDVGEGNGVYYLIMQYIAGEDLGRYLAREGRIPAADALHVITQIADALVAASGKGIVHRDLKPANIRLDAYGRVIVLDFGIAKAGDQPTALTTGGERWGTPYYMCPEQVRCEPCDQRSDLYTLGIIFYELLTGRRPFDGESYRVIEDGHLFTTPPAPADVDESIDPECSRIVMRMIEKDPPDRYQSAVELLRDLHAAAARLGSGTLHPRADQEVEDAPAEFTPPGRLSTAPAKPPSTKTRRRPAWPIYAGSLALLSLAIGGGVYFSHQNSPPAAAVQSEPKAERSHAGVALPRTLRDDSGVMLLVAGGNFLFGADATDSPNKRQSVNLPPFYIDATEVSNAAYRRFCAATGRAGPQSGAYAARPDYPVAGVTLADAEAFAAWAGKRIPTEQEWEKAARGADGRLYPWGNEAATLPASIQPVDALPERQSPYGALNMAGNVWEWTVTSFPVTDREIEDMQRVLGGAPVARDWFSIKGGSFTPNQESFFRSFMRRGWPRNLSSPFIGFRCVKDANAK